MSNYAEIVGRKILDEMAQKTTRPAVTEMPVDLLIHCLKCALAENNKAQYSPAEVIRLIEGVVGVRRYKP